MHQCQKCKAEFEGKFCPGCGTEWINKKICPRCGASSGIAMKFCSECGYRYEVEEKSCPQCGTKTNGAARFCEECGYSFAEENNSSYDATPTERPNKRLYSAPQAPKARAQN
ncbi:MAG: zinc ribbon domain-containing protein [Clostridiales bacterium]|nr:zinc ribbon domain-containing protein [Clostridiales bacterium]